MASSLAALDAATDAPVETNAVQPPDGALDYLRPSNPRLVDLTERYPQLPGAQSSRWSREFVGARVDLTAFRRDNPYVWSTRDAYVGENGTKRRVATRPINYALSGYYARLHDEVGVLDRSRDDGLFGSYRIRIDDEFVVSRDLLDSVLEINFLERHCGISKADDFTALDIGAGYGRLAHRLVENFPNARVYCLDGVPSSTFLCEYYLKVRGVADRALTVPLDELSKIPTGIDVAVNIHSWSECPLAVIEWWLDRLVELSVPTLMVVPNEGDRLLWLEMDGRRLDFALALQHRGYDRIALEPKYGTSVCQRLGIFPSQYHLFARTRSSA